MKMNENDFSNCHTLSTNKTSQHTLQIDFLPRITMQTNQTYGYGYYTSPQPFGYIAHPQLMECNTCSVLRAKVVQLEKQVSDLRTKLHSIDQPSLDGEKERGNACSKCRYPQEPCSCLKSCSRCTLLSERDREYILHQEHIWRVAGRYTDP